MDKKELLREWTSQLTQVKLKLKMTSFLMKQGIKVDENELNSLLERMQTLKKLIAEIEKEK